MNIVPVLASALRVPVCWLIVPLSFSACAGGEQPAAEASLENVTSEQSPATMMDACALLTSQEVSEVVGAPVQEMERTESSFTDHLICSYWGDAPVSVMVDTWRPGYSPPTADFYRRKEKQVRESYQYVEFIDGLGTAGMWLEEADMLHAVVPGYEVIVIGPKEHARVLIEKALVRLPRNST